MASEACSHHGKPLMSTANSAIGSSRMADQKRKRSGLSGICSGACAAELVNGYA